MNAQAPAQPDQQTQQPTGPIIDLRVSLGALEVILDALHKAPLPAVVSMPLVAAIKQQAELQLNAQQALADAAADGSKAKTQGATPNRAARRARARA